MEGKKMHKLIGKTCIKGRIVVKTGLHIGGSKTVLDIGGIDLNVIKTPFGVPYIPGSSLKGKLRSVMARKEGSMAIKEDSEEICLLFGRGADKKDAGSEKAASTETSQLTRLIFRDAMLDTKHFQKIFYGIDAEEMSPDGEEVSYTEVKTENTIDRMTGRANPRQLERIPAGAEFDFEIICNVFEGDDKISHLNLLIEAMKILKDDYLGGSGSRGYGQIDFNGMKFLYKSIDDYKNGVDWPGAPELPGIQTL